METVESVSIENSDAVSALMEVELKKNSRRLMMNLTFIAKVCVGLLFLHILIANIVKKNETSIFSSKLVDFFNSFDVGGG